MKANLMERMAIERKFYDELGSWCKAEEATDRYFKERELEDKLKASLGEVEK